jgi:hypothetical protein
VIGQNVWLAFGLFQAGYGTLAINSRSARNSASIADLMVGA